MIAADSNPNSDYPFKTVCYAGGRVYITQGWRTHLLAYVCGESWKQSNPNHTYEIVEEKPVDTGKGVSE